MSPDGIDVFPVSPNARSYRQIIYPAVLSIPSDYYPSTTAPSYPRISRFGLAKSYRNLRLVLDTGIGVGIPVM